MGWWSRAADEREADRQMFIEAIRMITDAQAKQAELMIRQLEGIQTYLNFLYANGEPVSRVMRDEDEYSLELERMKQTRRWSGDES